MHQLHGSLSQCVDQSQSTCFFAGIQGFWQGDGTLPETDGTIGIVSKVPIPRQLVSVSVSIQGFLESRYQYRYRSRALSIFWKVLAEFLLSKVSVSISVPVHFHGISISIGLDVDWVWVSVSVSVSIQGPIKYQYQYRLEISGPVCLCFAASFLPREVL